MGKLFGVLAAVILGAGILVSATRVTLAAAPECGHKACSDEVATSGLSGKARADCFKQVRAACEAGSCTCGGSSDNLGDCACSPSGAFLDGGN
jgi:hypothetical protein